MKKVLQKRMEITMLNKFASPTMDSMFKLIFGENKNKQVTIDFLNDFLERKDDNLIAEISFMHQEQTPRRLGEKKSILDIHCKDKAGHNFIIEIQRKREFFFDLRGLYYAASLLSRQLNDTDSYAQLKPVIIIGILDFNLYKPSKDAITHHMICDMSTGKQSINLIELHFIELSKFNKKINELKNQIDKWVFFLKEANQLEDYPEFCQDSPSLKTAFHILERANWTKEQTLQYEREVREFQRDITQELAEKEEAERIQKELALSKKELDNAKARLDDAKATLENTKATLENTKTTLENTKTTIENTKEALKETKQDIAINLLKMGLPIDAVAQGTGLSIEQIQALQKSLLAK